MATVAIPGRRTRGALTVQTISDRAVLRAFLEQDRLFAAYAICDLEDREFGRTRWGVGVPTATSSSRSSSSTAG